MRRNAPAKFSLPEPAYWALWLVFGACAIALLYTLNAPTLPTPDRAAVALATAFTATAVVWFFLLALQTSTLWSIAMLIPYVNLIAISIFARRYWQQGARTPAMLVIAALALQLALTLRWLLNPPAPVLL